MEEERDRTAPTNKRDRSGLGEYEKGLISDLNELLVDGKLMTTMHGQDMKVVKKIIDESDHDYMTRKQSNNFLGNTMLNETAALMRITNRKTNLPMMEVIKTPDSSQPDKK